MVDLNAEDEVGKTRLLQLKAMPYPEYLQTPEWRSKRDRVLARDGHRCRTCDSGEHLQVHHRTYARRGNEDLNDLTTLCEACHKHFHEKIKQNDLMEMTYTAPTVRKSQEDIAQSWEDTLVGMLLNNPALTLHVVGMLSDTDFTGEETRALYQVLTPVYQRSDPPAHSFEQYIPPALMVAATRCRTLAASDMPTDQAKQVKVVVQVASRMRCERLLQVNKEITGRIHEADKAGDRVLLRQLQTQQLEVMQQVRSVRTAMRLHSWS